MSFRNFIEQLRSDQLLHEINDSCSPYLEVSGLAHKKKGPVLFNDVMGHKIVINIIANRQCMAAA
ncbi:MAG: 3-polyprenyl-4-hydroxybenzoate decarboxylase, partial [Candidatus Methanocomedens sp.]